MGNVKAVKLLKSTRGTPVLLGDDGKHYGLPDSVSGWEAARETMKGVMDINLLIPYEGYVPQHKQEDYSLYTEVTDEVKGHVTH